MSIKFVKIDADGDLIITDEYGQSVKYAIPIEAEIVPIVKATVGFGLINELGAPTVKSGTLNDVRAAITLPDVSPLEVTTGITNPDIPRSINVKGSAAGITGTLIIDGTDYANAVISENYALADDSEIVGNKAFKSVTKITVPKKTTAGDTVVVGRGNKLGLHQVLSSTDKIILGLLNKAVQAATVAVNATVLNSNTVDMSAGAYGATKRAAVIIST